MSFAPTKSKHQVSERKHQQSPPKFSAEVVAKFDSNLRAFDPSRRKTSPKVFTQRKLSPNLSTQQQQTQQQSQHRTSSANKRNVTSPSTQKQNSSSGRNISSASHQKQRRASPYSGWSFGQSDNGPKKLFGGCLAFDDSLINRVSRWRSDENPFASSGEKRETEFPKDKPSAEWICVHSKLIETVHVEELLRKKYEELEFRLFAAFVQFRNSLEV